MRFAGQQDGLSAGGQVGLVLFGEQRHGEGVPAQGVGVAITRFQFAANRGNPHQMQAGSDEGHVPERGVVEGERQITDY